MSTTPSVAVTGAAGYLGSRVVEQLAEHAPLAVVRASVPYLPPERQLVLDLTAGPAPLAKHLHGVDTVVHLAGHNEVVAATDPGRALAETQLAALNVSRAAVEAGVPRIVYVSTVHVYGSAIREGATLDEEVVPAPTSMYAIARLACEHVITAAAAGHEVVVLRLTNAVGAPGDPAVDRWTLVASDLCRQAAVDGKVGLNTSGMQWRDFVALGDVATILAAACDRHRLPAGVYNLGSGRPVTVRDLAVVVQDRFEALTGTRPPLSAPEPEADPPGPYHVAVDRLASHNLRAETSVEDAVDELARFCLKHLAS